MPLHGVGGATDLPIPYLYALVGASWALTISFAVLALAWRQPKFEPVEVEVRARRPWLGAVGALVALWFGAALFLGPNENAQNGGIQAVYILVWVGLVPLALLFGHVWRDLSPWRSVQALVGRATGRPDGYLAYPARLGYWPAAFGLLAFVWLELASPDPGSVTAMCWWVAIYVAVTVTGGLVFGPTWFDRADPFDVYSAFVARLSPFAHGPRWVNPLRTLPTLPIHPGVVAVIAVLLGSTAFDSFGASEFWQSRTVGDVAQAATLVGFCVLVGVLFVGAATATGGVTAEERRRLPGLMAHSLVPIVVGYVFAHYLTYLLERGQGAVFALLDPFGRGWQPLGERSVDYFLTEHTATLGVLKVAFVVVGHVVAVVAAHDAALRVLPRSHRLTGQLAMLLLMVGYTFTGLYLLLSV